MVTREVVTSVDVIHVLLGLLGHVVGIRGTEALIEEHQDTRDPSTITESQVLQTLLMNLDVHLSVPIVYLFFTGWPIVQICKSLKLLCLLTLMSLI